MKKKNLKSKLSLKVTNLSLLAGPESRQVKGGAFSNVTCSGGVGCTTGPVDCPSQFTVCGTVSSPPVGC